MPTNTWITGVSDNGGLGRTVSWQTDTEANKGLYTVEVKAQGICSPPIAVTYTLDVKSQCFVRPFLFDQNTPVFTVPALSTNIYDPNPAILTWTDTQVFQDLICGPGEYSITMSPSGDPLISLFAASSTPPDHSLHILSTTDPLNVGTYDIIV